MIDNAKDFFLTEDVQVHQVRSREILRKYPEIKLLFRKNQKTFLILTLLVGMQLLVSYLIFYFKIQSLLPIMLLAYCIGAFVSHSLYVIIHEGTHDLIFKNKGLNNLSIISADLVNVIPTGIGFSVFHRKHHSKLGHEKMDLDVAFPWEARMIKNVWWRKALWLALFPVIQIIRSFRLSESELYRWPTALNIVAVLSVDYFIYINWGGYAILYLLFSMLFGLGLHPLGARWIQEHHTNDPNQETASYYGVLNKVALNMGYHNEHHDFPSIPWNQLPNVKKSAPEFYNSLSSYKSWTRLLINFIFSKEYTLFGRVVRKD